MLSKPNWLVAKSKGDKFTYRPFFVDSMLKLFLEHTFLFELHGTAISESALKLLKPQTPATTVLVSPTTFYRPSPDDRFESVVS